MSRDKRLAADSSICNGIVGTALSGVVFGNLGRWMRADGLDVWPEGEKERHRPRDSARDEDEEKRKRDMGLERNRLIRLI